MLNGLSCNFILLFAGLLETGFGCSFSSWSVIILMALADVWTFLTVLLFDFILCDVQLYFI